MAGWQELDNATLLSLDDGGHPVDALIALAELARAVRSAHAHLGARQTRIAQMILRDALVEINGWCEERRLGAVMH